MHFVIGVLIVGVLMRIVSLTGRLRFTDHAAAALILIGTVATVLAVQSGKDAHGPVERIPGARAAVVEHEKAAEWARNLFLTLAAVEIAALALARSGTRSHYAQHARMVSAIVGVVGVLALVKTADRGGDLVYSYAGGPGLRSGNPRDVERLLLAGLYLQSQADRKSGRNAEAASLVREMRRRYGSDTTVQFLYAESLLRDGKDSPGAMAALDSIHVSPEDARMRARLGSLKADIYVAKGMHDSARTVLSSLVAAYPTNTRLKAKLDSIK